MHGGATGTLRSDVPGRDLEHVHGHLAQECAQPADLHRGGPHTAGAAEDERR